MSTTEEKPRLIQSDAFEKGYDCIAWLYGKKIQKIFMNEDQLQFLTDQGTATFTVYGDCCSSSYFHDFLGVTKLLEGGPILKIEELPTTQGEASSRHDDVSIDVYGFRFTVEHSQWGKVSAVFSFRNYSNGYYGGSLNDPSFDPQTVSPEIIDDVLETVENPHKVDA